MQCKHAKDRGHVASLKPKRNGASGSKQTETERRVVNRVEEILRNGRPEETSTTSVGRTDCPQRRRALGDRASESIIALSKTTLKAVLTWWLAVS